MSLTEIDRLLLFRRKNKFINSEREFQKITQVSDSLLAKIAPYFKFPDWVSKVNQQKQRKKRTRQKVIWFQKTRLFPRKISIKPRKKI